MRVPARLAAIEDHGEHVLVGPCLGDEPVEGPIDVHAGGTSTVRRGRQLRVVGDDAASRAPMTVSGAASRRYGAAPARSISQ